MANQLKKRVKDLKQYDNIAQIFGGTYLENRPSVKEAMALCGLDWETLVIPVCLSDKLRTKIPGFWATYRRVGPSQNIPLGLVRGRYKPRQNGEEFAWIDGVLENNPEAKIVAGGMINNGARTWLAVELGSFEPVPGDKVTNTMLVMNSNDGSSNFSVHLVPARNLGWSALNFLDTDGICKIRHTAGADEKLKNMAPVIKQGIKTLEEFTKTCTAMSKRKLSTVELDTLIYRCLGVDDVEAGIWFSAEIGSAMKQPQWVNQYDAILEILNRSNLGLTVWGVYTSVCIYFDHIRTVRGSEAKQDNVFESRMVGYSAKNKSNAYLVCQAAIAKAAKVA